MEQNRIFERLAAFEGWLHENGRAAGTQEKYLRDVRRLRIGPTDALLPGSLLSQCWRR